MKVHRFEAEQWFARPRENVFKFFSNARNLERLTPPLLRFEILTPGPIEMRVGALIDYRLRVHGIPIRWQSEITVWEPPVRFVDTQRRGPYRWWVHEHEFVEDDGRTIMRDRVDYGVPGGAIVHRLLVRRQLLHIFDYRRSAIARRFGVVEAGSSGSVPGA